MLGLFKPKEKISVAIVPPAQWQALQLSESIKRKRFEEHLVAVIEDAQRQGLDIHFIAIDLEKNDRVNARITLKDKQTKDVD